MISWSNLMVGFSKSWKTLECYQPKVMRSWQSIMCFIQLLLVTALCMVTTDPLHEDRFFKKFQKPSSFQKHEWCYNVVSSPLPNVAMAMNNTFPRVAIGCHTLHDGDRPSTQQPIISQHMPIIIRLWVLPMVTFWGFFEKCKGKNDNEINSGQSGCRFHLPKHT